MCWLNEESYAHSNLEDAFRRTNLIEEMGFFIKMMVPWSMKFAIVEVEFDPEVGLSTKSLVFRMTISHGFLSSFQYKNIH